MDPMLSESGLQKHCLFEDTTRIWPHRDLGFKDYFMDYDEEELTSSDYQSSNEEKVESKRAFIDRRSLVELKKGKCDKKGGGICQRKNINCLSWCFIK